MHDKLTTSVSLPEDVARHWRAKQGEILRFAARYLRQQMRNPVRRGVTRRYNHEGSDFEIVTTRFTDAEYDTLHFVAASLRVSVSSLVYGLIQLWLKPAWRAIRRFFATNCTCSPLKWDTDAGMILEKLTFRCHETANTGSHHTPQGLQPIS